jgi:hypothetical protein
LAAPTNPTVVNVTSTGATLSWDAVPNATFYRIGYRSTGSRSSDFWISGSSPTTSYTTEASLGAGGTFEWRVTAMYQSSTTTVVSDFAYGPWFTLLTN